MIEKNTSNPDFAFCDILDAKTACQYVKYRTEAWEL